MTENQTEHPNTFPRSTDQGMVNRILLEKRSSRSCTAVRYPEKVIVQPKGDKSGTLKPPSYGTVWQVVWGAGVKILRLPDYADTDF
ncbi:MAG: hypothetical protein ACSHX6_02950 [Akkermansiaceae bacterium]